MMFVIKGGKLVYVSSPTNENCVCFYFALREIFLSKTQNFSY